jgi:hypothetical protein
MEFRLSSLQVKQSNFMTDAEFCHAIEQFFFVADNKHSIVSYRTSLAHAAWDSYESVPINKLAHILLLLCILFYFVHFKNKYINLINWLNSS